MALYRYKVLAESGRTVYGETLSSSKEELVADLEKSGYRVQSVTPSIHWLTPWKKKGIAPQEFLLFVNELLSLLKAGLPVVDALELTAERGDEAALEKVIEQVLHSVRNGSSLSDAFARHKDFIDQLFISVIKTGEQSGNLIAVLVQYQLYLVSRLKLNKKLKQALAYPTFLLGTLLIILAGMFLFVMPRFTSMYQSFGAELPAPTRLLMGIAEHLPVVVLVVITMSVALTVQFKRLKRQPQGARKLEDAAFSLPLVGKLYELAVVVRMSRSLAILISSGMPLLDALKSVRETIGNIRYSERLRRTEELVLGGGALTYAARETMLLPDTALKLIRAGEASGNLGGMLAETASLYHEALDASLDRAMSLLEPLLILLMGLVVGAVIIAMYLPIFNLAEIV